MTPQPPLVRFLDRYDLHASAQIAAHLTFADLESLLLICRCVQHSGIHEAFLKKARVVIPPLHEQERPCASFRLEIRVKLSAFLVTKAKDLAAIVASFPCVKNIYLEDASCTTQEIAQLAQVSSLTCLTLQSLDGVDISPLARLPNLKELNLTNSRFVGDLSAFSHLEFLVLDETMIDSIEFVTRLTVLKHLSLENTHNLKDLSPLGRLNEHHRLHTLELCNKSELDMSPLGCGALPSILSSLNVEGCTLRWSDRSAEELHSLFGSFMNLRELLLAEVKREVEGEDEPVKVPFPSLETPSFANIEKLDILDCSLGDLLPLARCCQLKVLCVNVTNILPVDVCATLRCLERLRQLQVEGARILDVLKVLPNLTALSCVRNVDWRRQTCLETGKTSQRCDREDIYPHTSLRALAMFKSAWYPQIGRVVPNIQILNVVGAVPEVHNLLVWPKLRSLRIDDSSYAIPSGFVPTVALSLPHLVGINIEGRRGLVLGIQSLAHSSILFKLRHLRLKNCASFTCQALFELESLQTLDLTGWRKVDYADALARSNGLSHLTSITIDRETSCRSFKLLSQRKLPMLVCILHPETNCRWDEPCQ